MKNHVTVLVVAGTVSAVRVGNVVALHWTVGADIIDLVQRTGP